MTRGSAPGSFSASRQGRHGLTAQRRQRGANASLGAQPLPVTPPGWLPADAQEVWVENLPRVLEHTTASDTEAFASWCVATALVRHWAASTERRAGEHLRACQRVALAYANTLGLTPRSRAGLPLALKQEPLDLAKQKREATIAELVR